MQRRDVAIGSVHFSEFSSDPIDVVEDDFNEQSCLYVKDDDLVCFCFKYFVLIWNRYIINIF